MSIGYISAFYTAFSQLFMALLFCLPSNANNFESLEENSDLNKRNQNEWDENLLDDKDRMKKSRINKTNDGIIVSDSRFNNYSRSNYVFCVSECESTYSYNLPVLDCIDNCKKYNKFNLEIHSSYLPDSFFERMIIFAIGCSLLSIALFLSVSYSRNA